MRYIEAAAGRDARVVWSASDLKAAAECEFAWLRAIDAKLGRIPAVPDPEDPTLERAGRLGTAHELRVLARYRERFGDAVVEIPETRSTDDAAMSAAVAATRAALADPAVEVLYQAAFATEEFVGFADFLVRDHAAPGSPWRVQDTKLARHARVTALMQLAAYVDQLDLLTVPRSGAVDLLLGDGSTSTHAVADLLPVFRLRRRRLADLIADRRIVDGAAGTPIAWGDARGDLQVLACGRCPTCEQEVVASRDLLLVAGMRPVQRQRLRDAGVTTIDALAASPGAPEGMRAEVFEGLREQARLQLASPAGVPEPGEAPAGRPPVPEYEVALPAALAGLPRRDPGDLFFDFEGDPLYTEGDAGVWGIEYLFGWVDSASRYGTLWAHDFAGEKQAFERFIDMVTLLRRTNPGMHVYHYAPYEPAHLLEMAGRYGTRESELDRLLREGVFVDLYPIVRRALRVGSRSYSIKKLEPLYMGDDVRTSDVQRGDDSIVRYVEARMLCDAGDEAGAQAILDDLAEYNRDDCVSTLRLRDWLVDRAREAGLMPSLAPDSAEFVYEPSPRALALTRLAAAAAPAPAAPGAVTPDADPDAVALRLAAAAIDYYPREAKTFWAGHFLRLREPVSLWEQTRDVVVVDPARSSVREQWHRPDGQRVFRRLVELRGELAPGTRLSEGSQPFVLYELPAPFPYAPSPRWIHGARQVTVVEVLEDGAVVQENAVDGETWDPLPFALTPPSPPNAGQQQSAIDVWADGLIDAAPDFPEDPATDILLRRPPRTRAGLARGEGDVDDIVRSILDLDRSYLAVQGPPGTGKTHVGSHVIATLVQEHGFRVGVVAQSHAVVENMLDRVVAAGVPAEKVGKAPKDPAAKTSFTPVPKNGLAQFVADRPGGFVVGGTAWDFAHPQRVARGSLDLLVIDEAGQFSLASTVAVAISARRLLLLGDPQQLPQVSQGTHPEPVDTSALGWVMGDEPVIDPDRGYFLARTWRMRPEVAAPVSVLSYAGELEAAPVTAHRVLEGVEPGVHAVPVAHRGNAVQSPEEAAEVVRIVRDVLGRTWTDADERDGGVVTDPPRPLTTADVIVVTPYNAQQVMVEEALAAAGIDGVRVGTVDRFQGQEAVVAIVSLAASSGRDAPRGLEFLLLQNRLNVAISRAQHTAYVLYSPGLLDDLPRTPEGVARLSAFATLVGA
ncbi:TM0106 family RecB-like putative nuclease [Microbacterium sp. GXF7504]